MKRVINDNGPVFEGADQVTSFYLMERVAAQPKRIVRERVCLAILRFAGYNFTRISFFDDKCSKSYVFLRERVLGFVFFFWLKSISTNAAVTNQIEFINRFMILKQNLQ